MLPSPLYNTYLYDYQSPELYPFTLKAYCYTRQLKYAFRLEENVSRAIGQISITPWGEQNSLTPKGNNNLNFQLARDQVVHLETAENLCAQSA